MSSEAIRAPSERNQSAIGRTQGGERFGGRGFALRASDRHVSCSHSMICNCRWTPCLTAEQPRRRGRIAAGRGARGLGGGGGGGGGGGASCGFRSRELLVSIVDEHFEGGRT